MKKLFLSILLLFATSVFAQVTQYYHTSPTTKPFDQEIVTGNYKVIVYSLPITLGKAATNYSDVFDITGYLPVDSTHNCWVSWQANDTCQVSLSLLVGNSPVPAGATPTYATWATLTATPQQNAGNDTVYTKFVVPWSNSSQTGIIVPGNYFGNMLKIKVAFANATTVGDNGYLRVWVYLKKQ